VNDCGLKDMGKMKVLKVVNSGGWKDTVLWSPFGNEGMGYKNFLCVESVAYDAVTLPSKGRWAAGLKLIPTNIRVDPRK
jgi:glucose-6-phosphate 1-epimerase